MQVEAVIKLGLPISLALHLTVFGGFTLFSASAKPLEPGKVIPVEILSVDEVTNVSASIKQPKPKPKPKVEPPEVMTTQTPMKNAENEGETVKITPKDATPEKPVEPIIPKETDEPVPEKQAEVIVPVETEDPVIIEPETPKEAEPPTFDLNKIAGLVDKTRETAPDKNQQIALQSETNNIRYDEFAREAVGEGSGMSATEIDLLVSAMQKCWRMPAAAQDAENLRVRLSVNFILGGHVENVELIDQAASRRLSPGNPFWAQAEREAISAVHKCAPYDFLPDERYGVWRELVLNLRPEL